MGRAMLGFCAGWLVALAGCTSTGGFLLFENKGTGDRVIAASLDSVAQSATASLTSLRMAASVTRQGEAVVITSNTPNGQRFNLVLTREKGEPGAKEKTRVHLEWAGAKDEQTGFQVLSQVEAKVSR
jgi:hypothetical protein